MKRIASDREPTTEELKDKRRPETQFGRAMRELGVKLILARSPQAKGRVERANGVLQDRLVKEMRLAKVRTLEEANVWLEESGYFETLNDLQAIEPLEKADGHRPLVVNLEEVLCVKEKRQVGNDLCVQWNGRVLQLKPHKGRNRPEAVEVREQCGVGSCATTRHDRLDENRKRLHRAPTMITRGWTLGSVRCVVWGSLSVLRGLRVNVRVRRLPSPTQAGR